jgi:serine/threonine protein kinase
MTATTHPFPATERVPEAARQRTLKEAICPSCGTRNRAAAKFCIGCVGPLAGAESAPPEEASAPQSQLHYAATEAFTRAETLAEKDRCWTSSLSRHALPDGTTIEGFQILRLLGEGGFGIVYLAWDPVLERHVALKEYMPSTLAVRDTDTLAVTMRSERHRDTFDAGLRSFLNEARLLARFDHPALLKVFRFWEAHGTAYMAMPYYEGPTLKEALAGETSAPSEQQLCEWLHPLLDALAAIHQEQCLHRDISPDNILLTSTGPVLLDFGAARRVISDMTQSLTTVLKPGFAPIEQYGGVMLQGPWTDLYALAGVVYHAITGRLPPASAGRVVSDGFEPLTVSHGGRYSERFLHAIDATLSLRPEGRPQDVAQFRALINVPAAGDEPPQPAAARVQEALEVPAKTGQAADEPRVSVDRASLATHGWTTLYVAPAAAPVEPTAPEAAVPAPRRMRIAPVVLLALALAGGTVVWLGTLSAPPSAGASAPDMPLSVARPEAATPLPPTALAAPGAPLPDAAPAAPADPPKPSAMRSADRAAAPARTAAVMPKPSPARPKPAPSAPEAAPAARRAEAPPIAVAAEASKPARCSDLVLKSSLDRLSPDEITFQRSQCK